MPRTPSSIYSIIPVLVLFLTSCAPKPFSIEGEDFPASDGCNGVGVFEIRTEGGEVQATAQGEIQVELLVGGTMGTTLWCHGMRHAFHGQVEYGGYTFASEAEGPLQFVVDRDRGFYYEQGAGTVTAPDGEVTTFQ